jgi:hypothetical protein
LEGCARDSRRATTERIDAKVLAQLLAVGFLHRARQTGRRDPAAVDLAA